MKALLTFKEFLESLFYVKGRFEFPSNYANSERTYVFVITDKEDGRRYLDIPYIQYSHKNQNVKYLIENIFEPVTDYNIEYFLDEVNAEFAEEKSDSKYLVTSYKVRHSELETITGELPDMDRLFERFVLKSHTGFDCTPFYELLSKYDLIP